MAGVIKNASVLASTPLRIDALAIAEAGYAAVDVEAAIRRKARVENEELVMDTGRWGLKGRRVFFVGVGKCSLAGAEAIEALLGDYLTAGIALDVRHAPHALSKIAVFAGTHPKPSEANTQAAGLIVKLLSGCTEDDLVIMLISGGGSSLLCLHDQPMTCLDEGLLFDAMTMAGATIRELNTVRKHISKARGGGLAAAAYPAEVLALIISDVPGNDISFIASGPTVKDSSTVDDAQRILARYAIPLPPGGLLETPKDEKYFARVSNTLFLTNRDALTAMQTEARVRGYESRIVADDISGEAREVGESALSLIHTAPSKSTLLWGGETTVTLRGAHGAGGRNQELALSAIDAVGDNELILAFASDGRDASAHAGAIADRETKRHAREKGLSASEALDRHASFDFFAACGDALETGLLESNVSDLLIGLKG